MSEQFLATASVRIVPDVTGFAAALQAEVTAATRAIRVPAVSSAIAANTVATRTFTAATGTSTLAVEQNTAELVKHGSAAAVDAAETEIDAKAARASAIAHGQMARGLATATASQFGLRGAVLASSGPFLAAVVGVEILRKSLDAFTAEQEAAARATKVFGPAAKELVDSAKDMAVSFGLSAETALKYEGAIGEVFKTSHVLAGQNAELSKSLVQVAVDSAAFNNLPTADALRAIQLALSGNLRGIRQYIPGVTAAEIKQRALINSGKALASELTQQNLVVARAQVIIERAANQAGSYQQRQNSLAGETRTLSANVGNLAASLGALLSPALQELAKEANAVLSPLVKLIDLAKGIPSPVEKASDSGSHFQRVLRDIRRDLEKSIIAPVAVVVDVLHQFGIGANDAASSAENVQAAIDSLHASTAGTAGGFDAMGRSINLVTGELQAGGSALGAYLSELQAIQGGLSSITNLNNRLLAQQIAGASSADRIATLQAKAAAAQDILTALGGPRGARGRQALQTKAQAVAEIKSIRDADAAAAKAAASAAEAAANKARAAAEAARRAHDQGIQTAIDDLQFADDLRHLKAQRTKSLVDDLAADRVTLKTIDQQIALAAQILDATTRKQKIQALTLARETAAQQITTDKAAQLQRQKDHRDLIRSRTEQRLQLDIEIATTNKNISAEKRALEARIAYDRLQLANVKGDIVRKKQLQLEIAQDTQTLKDLKKSKQENMGASAAFLFLQTQQGFAGTLLGNLLSASATAGTVGGTAGAISTHTAVGPQLSGGTGISPTGSSGGGSFGGGGGGFDVTADVRTDQQTSAGPAGVTSGQMATLIHVQREMLRVLLRMTGQRTHPEATHQRTWAATEMLNTGW